jgi:hypothetical protein
MLKGSSPDIMGQNVRDMRKSGKSEIESTKMAMKKSHPNRHKNLGKFLHKKGAKDSSTRPPAVANAPFPIDKVVPNDQGEGIDAKPSTPNFTKT